MNDSRARTGGAWSRASSTAAELHEEWGTSVPLTYFVVWLAGGFVVALFIGWLTAPFALWRGAGGTLQLFGVILVALHLKERKRAGRESRLQQLATELRMLWHNVTSREPLPGPNAAATMARGEEDAASLHEQLTLLEAAVLELRKEFDAQYVGPLSGLKPPRPAVEAMSVQHETAARAPAARMQLQWVGVGWILIGIILATWS